ncbi:hypothetical protein DW322_04270 [Rhodococcus rhodnii]|uniref:CobQ/CobB/MinD/ParA nucleotide binding domain-containing protein n=2 Tax=Rhodococcus rhodnii TaxID=38312 RepID=R7WJV9_9NOCA|nr:hypothetical protein [Rhodococcus rhodnii]EOM74274.1 hypothetical protein Rrhod_4418 [Rhodococcus rhodnii LMG 5362]TXG89578.1 hypothetical protein DW322_04270 [Rhodococcus rhodnii]
MSPPLTWVPYPTAVIVAGACGGAGATTTALGLANIAVTQGVPIVAVDATPAGDDIADRGADAMTAELGIEQLLATTSDGIIGDDAFMRASSHTSTGARILQRTGTTLANDREYRAIADYLRARHASGLYSVGHRLGADYLAPILRSRHAPMALVVPCRVDAINRMRFTLDAIAAAAGRDLLQRTVIAISHQDPNGWKVDVDLLRRYLEGQIHAILEIPYDQHLASGTLIEPSRLAPPTVTAYSMLARALAEASDDAS